MSATAKMYSTNNGSDLPAQNQSFGSYNAGMATHHVYPSTTTPVHITPQFSMVPRGQPSERKCLQSVNMVRVKEQEMFLPVANVLRIMKGALPKNSKISKEAKECIKECVSEFILFITSEASERCQQEKRRTVSGDDILYAMMSLGFENYAKALSTYISKYRKQSKKGGPTKAFYDAEDDVLTLFLTQEAYSSEE